MICSAGFHDPFPPKFEESSRRVKKIKMIHIQNVLNLFSFSNDPY